MGTVVGSFVVGPLVVGSRVGSSLGLRVGSSVGENEGLGVGV